MNLYTPEDLMTVEEFLRSKFGDSRPTKDTLAQWQYAELRQFARSPHFAVSNYFMTRDEITNNLTRMRPFTGQAILSVCYEAQRRAGYARQIWEYKPRQCGWTSWDLGLAILNALQPNRSSLILVDDEDVGDKIATKVATMVNSIPDWMQPMRRLQSLKYIHFENPNPKERIYEPGLNSSLQIAVPTSFRGDTPPFVLISEFAFMNDQRKALVTEGLIPAMHMTEHVTLIVDTTPNGFDLYYEPKIREIMADNPKWTKRIMEARNLTAEQVLAGKLGVPDRLDRAVPAISFWHHHEGYTTRDDNPRGELRKMTREQIGELQSSIGQMNRYGNEEELHLQKYWNLSDGQLYWRRRKIDNSNAPTPEARLLSFHQEFPADIDSGFVNYERSPFDSECMDAVMRQGCVPKARGILRENDKGVIGVDQTFVSDWQEFRLYEPPRSNQMYSLGIDTQTNFESIESDATVCQVVRFSDQKVCATYEARVPAHTLMKQLWLIYLWYQHPYYAIETKGIGFALVRDCIDMGMTNCYYWRRYDKDHAEPTSFPGWDTNARTRPLMDEVLIKGICERNPETNRPMPGFICPDRSTLKQLQSLTRTQTGALKAQNGHDDCADALAIALYIQRDPWGGFVKDMNKRNSTGKAEDFERAFAEAEHTAKRFGPRTYGGSRNQPDVSTI
jgi:hypothetical protein